MVHLYMFDSFSRGRTIAQCGSNMHLQSCLMQKRLRMKEKRTCGISSGVRINKREDKSGIVLAKSYII